MIALHATTDATDTVAALRGIADGLPDRLEAAVEATARMLEDGLKDEAPVGKPAFDWEGQPTNTPGALRDSIRFDLDGLTASFAAIDYASFVIGGTSPHVIQGNPLLSFDWDKAGGFVVLASVRHPGTAPNDFRAAAAARAADEADDQLEALGDWVAEMAA